MKKTVIILVSFVIAAALIAIYVIINKNNYDKANPDDALAYNNMGIAYDNKGNYDEAIACYKKAIKLNPDFVMAYGNLGIAYYSKGNYDKAIACYEKAIELNPDFADAYYNMGTAYQYSGKKDKANECFQKANMIKNRGTNKK